MSQDRSLDEFADETASTDADMGRADEPDDSIESDIDVTFAWTNEKAVCAECGERVERRWHADTGLVCESCKCW